MSGAPSELGDAETHGRGDRNCVLLLLFHKGGNGGRGQQEVLRSERTGAPRGTAEDRNHGYLKQ